MKSGDERWVGGWLRNNGPLIYCLTPSLGHFNKSILVPQPNFRRKAVDMLDLLPRPPQSARINKHDCVFVSSAKKTKRNYSPLIEDLKAKRSPGAAYTRIGPDPNPSREYAPRAPAAPALPVARPMPRGLSRRGHQTGRAARTAPQHSYPTCLPARRWLLAP